MSEDCHDSNNTEQDFLGIDPDNYTNTKEKHMSQHHIVSLIPDGFRKNKLTILIAFMGILVGMTIGDPAMDLLDGDDQLVFQTLEFDTLRTPTVFLLGATTHGMIYPAIVQGDTMTLEKRMVLPEDSALVDFNQWMWTGEELQGFRSIVRRIR